MRIISYKDIDRAEWGALVQGSSTGTWFQTPEAYEFFTAQPELFKPFAYVKNKENKVVFLKSRNEWGEGNYMEPCIQYGHGYLQALRCAIEEC